MNLNIKQIISDLDKELPSKEFLSARQVAKVLNPFFKVSHQTLIKWSKTTDGIPSVQVMGRLFLSRSGLLSWLENQIGKNSNHPHILTKNITTKDS